MATAHVVTTSLSALLKDAEVLQNALGSETAALNAGLAQARAILAPDDPPFENPELDRLMKEAAQKELEELDGTHEAELAALEASAADSKAGGAKADKEKAKDSAEAKPARERMAATMGQAWLVPA